jgi:methyltransferase-like protein/2-polyprenyl-3-methyl-5-hydroxy-6-metoxy-1,4-benzoquinol methylase
MEGIMTNENGKRYDEVPYESQPFAFSHPRWLATVATLFGMKPPPPEHARILELGCASGGNLVPMAETLPGCSCLGIDLSPRQIEDGCAFIAETGLRNVELRQASILDVDDSYGSFDYIICHGVYSWVDRNIQQKILELCGERLSPSGIAYISYNTYPGWHMKGMLRDMMRFHANRFEAPMKQIAQSRALLNALAKAVPSQDNPYGMLLKSESEELRRRSDWYIYHEHLEPENDPVYFHEFAKRASDAGLQYLGESELRAMLTSQFSPEIQAVLREVATTLVMTEQYMDFFRNRTFRQTLLCRNGILLGRDLNVDSFRPFSFASGVRPTAPIADVTQDGPVKFEAAEWPTATVNGPIGKAALLCLREAWPQFVAWPDLENRVRTRLGLPPGTPETAQSFVSTMGTWFMKGLVTMSLSLPPCVSKVSERPVAGVVARTQVRLGKLEVSTLLHRNVKLGPFDAGVLGLLDGTRDRSAIVEHMMNAPHAGDAQIKQRASNLRAVDIHVDKSLTLLAELGLLCG